MSLRIRLIAISVGLVVTALAVADGAAYASVRSFLLDQANRDVVAASASVQKIWGQGLSGRPALDALKAGRALETAYVVLDAGGGVALSLPATRFGKEELLPIPRFSREQLTISPLTSAGQTVKTIVVGGADKTPDYLVAAYEAKSGEVIAVALPLDALSTTLDKLLQSEVAAAAAVVVAMLLAATLLIRLGLRPLTEIERTAAAISAGDLGRRVASTSRRTEVGRLGLAVNSMLDRIESSFAAERAADARLRQLVTDAAHELRTPLTSLRGYAELFRRGAASTPDQLAASMRGIEEEAQRMAALVDDLLLLARLDEGQPMATGPVDLAAVAREAIDAARAVEPDRELTLDAPSGALVLGDRGRLRQLIDNLLANVRVHTPARTDAQVAIRATPARVSLDVIDHGPGLTTVAMEHVFERFYRADPARSRDSGGAGLGLAIVAAIAAAHGGTVSVSSTEGGGATFRVELPAAGPDEAA